MINGKYVNINTVMEGVFRDYGFTHEVDWVDIIEWVGEGLDLIGAPKQYVDKVTDGNESLFHPCPIKINNFRGELPCDIYKVKQIREWKNKYPMVYATDSFQKSLDANTTSDDISKSFNSYGTIDFNSDLIVVQETGDRCAPELSYTLNNNYIFTNFKEGEVEIAYRAYPCDPDGYPLIPDDVSYLKAMKSYIAERIGFKLWMQDKLRGDKYQMLKQDRDWYLGKAKTSGLMPSTLDEFESWKNQTLRLMPIVTQHRNGFAGNSNPAKYNNQNSY